MVTKHGSNIRGTFGYLDPEYISTRTFTKKSDVYSYGVLLFELIAGRNPLQGLMEYVELVSAYTFLNKQSMQEKEQANSGLIHRPHLLSEWWCFCDRRL